MDTNILHVVEDPLIGSAWTWEYCPDCDAPVILDEFRNLKYHAEYGFQLFPRINYETEKTKLDFIQYLNCEAEELCEKGKL